MRTLIGATIALGLTLTGCSVAYHTQYVGEGLQNVPESTVMSEAIGKDVVVSYKNGEAVKGEMVSSTTDSLNIITHMGAMTFPRSGIAELRTGGSVAGSIIGFVLGVSGGAFLGGSLGVGLGGAGKRGWDELSGSLNGGMIGMSIGAIAGGWAGIVVGRNASAGNVYVWPLK